jgi:ribosome modulation factor
MDTFRQQCMYEEEGAAAALEGKVREDCPYDKATEDTAWNFWVYGNENQQGELVREFMAAEGTPMLWMSTGDLTPETEAKLKKWSEQSLDAMTRMRQERGWKPITPTY